MIVGLFQAEWRLLLERHSESDHIQMISGVEEAIVRGLTQSEGTPDAQSELKVSWNQWALHLCEGKHHPVVALCGDLKRTRDANGVAACVPVANSRSQKLLHLPDSGRLFRAASEQVSAAADGAAGSAGGDADLG